MPTITTAETLCGPRPLPHTSAFLRWVDEYISRRSRQCQSRRTNVFYIDPGAADNSQGTAALPWNNLGRVRTWLAANPSGDARFLFRRGTILRDTIGLVLTQPNLYFGSYGKAVVGNTTDKPIISHFTVQWASGGTRWTQHLTTGRWFSSVAVGPSGSSANPNLAGGSPASTVGFVRVADDPLSPLIAVGSTAAVESTPGSFFVSSGTVHINVDGDPNTLNIEAVPVQASPPDGFSIQNGSTGIWINGIRTDGWGCGAIGLAVQSPSGANSSGIRNLAGGTAAQAEHVALITNCESYYNGAHAISQEPGGIGGTHLVIGCQAGYGYNGNNGEALFNTYAGSAQQECVFKECVARFGALPQNVSPFPIAQGAAIVKQAGAFYGHQGPSGTNPVGLYLNIDCRIADERSSIPAATTYCDKWTFSESTDSMFAGTTAADPASLRAFVIGWKSPRTRIVDATFDFNTNKPPALGVARIVFINSHFYVRRTWSVTFADPVWQNFGGVAINTIFELDDEVGDRTALWDYGGTVATGARLINCMIIARGAMAANGADDQVCMSDANAKDRVRLANTVLLGLDRVMDPTNGLRINLTRTTFTSALINDPESIRYLAVAGCLLTDSGSYRGFSNATGLVNLETLNNTYPDLMNMIGSGSNYGNNWTSTYTLDPASPLAGAGAAVPFADKSDMLPAPEYDFFGRRRPSRPSIGPFDVLNVSAGGGIPATGTGSGPGTDGFVRGVI